MGGMLSLAASWTAGKDVVYVASTVISSVTMHDLVHGTRSAAYVLDGATVKTSV